MDWRSLGGSLIKAGAPIIGTAIGGPIGGVLGNTLGQVLATALGTEDTPEAVQEAIETMPQEELQSRLEAAEAEAQARWPAIAEIVKAEADAHARSLTEVNLTMRSEAASADVVQRWWRPLYAFELVIECVGIWLIVLIDIHFSRGDIANFVIASQSLLTTYWMARFGVLGVYVGGRSIEKLYGAASPVIEKISSIKG